MTSDHREAMLPEVALAVVQFLAAELKTYVRHQKYVSWQLAGLGLGLAVIFWIQSQRSIQPVLDFFWNILIFKIFQTDLN